MSSVSKIDMLTRVEGHGSVELIRDGVKVVDARLDLRESPRLFEALVVGRRFDEIPDIACRICSICSTVHKVAALQAVEQAMGVKISRQTGLLRELAVQGGQIESHALHIFCLALPDYLGVTGIQTLSKLEPDKFQMGLRIKKLGNLIQEIVGGRAIHPFNLLVGGVGSVPDARQLLELRERLEMVIDDVNSSFTYVFGLNDILPILSVYPCCAVSGGPPLFGDLLKTSSGETIHAERAIAWLNEKVELHTHAKISLFDEATPFMVGPLARLKLSIPEGEAHQYIEASIRYSLKARMVELKLAVERAQVLTGQLLSEGIKKELPVSVTPVSGEGTSLVEAPRGVLLHHYGFDSHGICNAACIITPTSINQRAIAATLKELIFTMEGAGYEEIRSAAEILIRCYDPCISCAVH